MNRKNKCIFDFLGNGKIELGEMWGIGLARFLSGVLYIIPDAPRRQLPIDRPGGPYYLESVLAQFRVQTSPTPAP